MRRTDGAGLTLLKVTRNPEARLVSIFRHACRYPFLHDEVRSRLGFDPAVDGFSLADLDALLTSFAAVPPASLDPHLRVQASPLWDMGFDRIITLNKDEVPLNPSLNAVERDLGLPVTDFAAIPAFAALREVHYAREQDFDRPEALEQYRFHRRETDGFPKRQLRVTPLLAQIAAVHYAADAAGTASADTHGRLFTRAATEA